ncbi:MAG: DUF58 domain-containing protein, partial [Candidatus Eremiobacteraeota bacterium]|nr:DUF58 domain-containing protein [Candidatus Eremiobacteraeota bacterium]
MVPAPLLGILFILGGLILALGAWKTLFLWMWAGYTIILLIVALYDYSSIPGHGNFVINRTGDNRLSLGTSNPISIRIRNRAEVFHKIQLKDEPPEYFKAYNRLMEDNLLPGEEKKLTYHVLPLLRGTFEFGDINLRCLSRLGLFWRQFKYPGKWEVRVYPNLQEIKKYELLTKKGSPLDTGLKISRILGLGREFERLREYQPDDEYRQINWKATARRGKPISQIYQTECYQEVIIVLDTGRTMTSPIGGMERLDYAINGALLLAFAASKHGDRVGLLVFSNKITSYYP